MMFITLDIKSNVFGPEEHPRSAMTMVLGTRVVYTSFMAFSMTGMVCKITFS